MPVVPAVAVMAGLAIEPLARRRHWAAASALATAVGLFVYQVVLVTAVLPLQAERFSAPRRTRRRPRCHHRRSAGAGLHARKAPGQQALLRHAHDPQHHGGRSCLLPLGAGVDIRTEIPAGDRSRPCTPISWSARSRPQRPAPALSWPGSSGARTGPRRPEQGIETATRRASGSPCIPSGPGSGRARGRTGSGEVTRCARPPAAPKRRYRTVSETSAPGPGPLGRRAKDRRGAVNRSAHTLVSASSTIVHDIFDWPVRRSSKTIGTSTTLNPFLAKR